jgi:hypothetical protein
MREAQLRWSGEAILLRRSTDWGSVDGAQERIALKIRRPQNKSNFNALNLRCDVGTRPFFDPDVSNRGGAYVSTAP